MFGLVACGPSEEQTECEREGGSWESTTEYKYAFSPSTGKYEGVLVTVNYCDWP